MTVSRLTRFWCLCPSVNKRFYCHSCAHRNGDGDGVCSVVFTNGAVLPLAPLSNCSKWSNCTISGVSCFAMNRFIYHLYPWKMIEYNGVWKGRLNNRFFTIALNGMISITDGSRCATMLIHCSSKTALLRPSFDVRTYIYSRMSPKKYGLLCKTGVT